MKIIRYLILILILTVAVGATYFLVTEQLMFMWEEESGGVCNPHVYAGIKAFGKVIYAKQIACPVI